MYRGILSCIKIESHMDCSRGGWWMEPYSGGLLGNACKNRATIALEVSIVMSFVLRTLLFAGLLGANPR